MEKIERIKCGNGNCFAVYNDNAGILIDTCRDAYKRKIFDAVKDKNINLIVLTHGHVDHIQNAEYLARFLHVPVAIHAADLELIESNYAQKMYADSLFGKIVLKLSEKSFKEDEIPKFTPEVILRDEDSLGEYGVNASIVELPGHTNGSIGIKVGNSDIIVGDALMNIFGPSKSLLYGDVMEMYKSAQKVSQMGDIKVHFGHGKPLMNRTWK